MAIAGRSYANVPVVVRGSLEDPSDFNSRTQVVVVAAPYDRRWFLVPPLIASANPPIPPLVVTASAAGVVTPVSLAVPAVRQAGSWWQLLSVRQHAREEFDFWASHPPPSCPRCGEPLINAPTADSGSGAELFCRFDGWQYPRDWVRPMLY